MKDITKWDVDIFDKFKNTMPRRTLLKLEGNFRTKKKKKGSIGFRYKEIKIIYPGGKFIGVVPHKRVHKLER